MRGEDHHRVAEVLIVGTQQTHRQIFPLAIQDWKGLRKLSNYLVAPVKEKHEIWAGWDPMLNSYFAHVIDTEKDEDDEGRDVLRVGCRPDEIHNVEEIVDALKPFMLYDANELYENLYRDANA